MTMFKFEMPKTPSQAEIERQIREQLKKMLYKEKKDANSPMVDGGYIWVQEHYPDDNTVLFMCHDKSYFAKYTQKGSTITVDPMIAEAVSAGWKQKGDVFNISKLKEK
jgi:hypothetical protein